MKNLSKSKKFKKLVKNISNSTANSGKATFFHLAKFISYVFVPPSFAFLLLLFYTVETSDSFDQKFFVILGHSLVFSLVLPILFFLILMRKGKVVDFDATIKEERLIPYLFGILLSLIAIISAHYLDFNKIFIEIWFVYLINSIILIVINKYWKISAHSIGAAIPLGALLYFYGNLAILFLPVNLLIMWSRVYLKKHDFAQVFVGLVYGAMLTYGSLLIF